MGFLEIASSLSGHFGIGDAAMVGAGLMHELESSPQGILEVFQTFRKNGLGGLIHQWATGKSQQATTDEIQDGLAGTALIDNIAQRTGLSSHAVELGMATLLPLVIHHLVTSGYSNQDGTPTGVPTPDASNVLQSILAKLL